ncbi:hypothetical protein PSP31121_04807 [Pandoraea sputorum]|uniref:Uncharacterized protein n=2 Tax=Pandoraea sputorum TaxID=93222 RepID=A0A5E5BF73_9BURK|nr:hypothetical protein PSP31121_04807 [Pandoraea sputorum]
MLNAPMPLGECESLSAVGTCLADRFCRVDGSPPARLLISTPNEEHHAYVNLSAIRNDQSLTHEGRGLEVLKRIAACMAPTLLSRCEDLVAASAAALEIATQLGAPEFATLERTAVQRAMGQRMAVEPLSTTHIDLGGDGKVLVRQTSQWSAYVDEQGQRVGFGVEDMPILEAGFAAAFWLERIDSHTSDTAGKKSFALHGNVQHCFLETPDAALKAAFVGRPPNFADDVLHGVARLFDEAQIHIEPPTHEAGGQRPPSAILDVAERRIERSEADGQAHRRTMGLATITDATGVRVGKPPGTSHSPALVLNQLSQLSATFEFNRKAALAFGQDCASLVSGLISKSYTRSEAENAPLEKLEESKELIRAIRDEFNHFVPSTTEDFLRYVSKCLASSAGNCQEMAMVAATVVQTRAREFLMARGLEHFDFQAEIYDSRPGDHAICVLNVDVDDYIHEIAIDPWMGVAMLYEDYEKYIIANPMPPYTDITKFKPDDSVLDILSEPNFIDEARKVLKDYISLEPSTQSVLNNS